MMRSRAVLVSTSAAMAMAAWAGVGGCLRVDHGILVELTLSALPAGAASRVWSEDGSELVVDAGEITVTEARLLACRPDASARLEAMARALLAPSRAHAQHDHSGSHADSPLVIRGPFRVSLVDEPAVLGAFAAPPGRYCSVHLELGAAPDESDASPWTLAMHAHTPAGAYVAAWSDAPGIGHVELAEPIVLDRGGTTRLHASLFVERPFARLAGLTQPPPELGAAILRGVAAQSAIVEEPMPPRDMP